MISGDWSKEVLRNPVTVQIGRSAPASSVSQRALPGTAEPSKRRLLEEYSIPDKKPIPYCFRGAPSTVSRTLGGTTI